MFTRTLKATFDVDMDEEVISWLELHSEDVFENIYEKVVAACSLTKKDN